MIPPYWCRTDFGYLGGRDPSELDHLDVCIECGVGGDLVLCEGPCIGSYHLDCAQLKEEPKDDEWFCANCKNLQTKRKEIYDATNGKSSRFKPGNYKF